MIILITGATHSGKTACAQMLLEKYHIPYLSQDHLKMGLIRSGYGDFTVDLSDDALTAKVWPMTKEIIKTAIENKQNLIVEGCYIPFNWMNDFEDEYLKEIKYLCLCLSEQYINNHYFDIMKFENCIENRIPDDYCTKGLLIRENKRFIEGCQAFKLNYILIEDNYKKTIEKIVEEMN